MSGVGGGGGVGGEAPPLSPWSGQLMLGPGWWGEVGGVSRLANINTGLRSPCQHVSSIVNDIGIGMWGGGSWGGSGVGGKLGCQL